MHPWQQWPLGGKEWCSLELLALSFLCRVKVILKDDQRYPLKVFGHAWFNFL